MRYQADARAGDHALRSKIPVCSTTRVKSASVFSLMMVDGSGGRRILRRATATSYHNHHQQERQLGLP
jgi:hypothetical protein